MGLNIKHNIEANFLERFITVKKMIEILKEIEGDWELLPNSVGNLSLFSPDSEEKGFIDIAEEKYNKIK